MKTLKKLLLALILSTAAFNAFAKDAVYSCEDYDVKLCYNDSANPGDAVFVKMKIIQNSQKKSKTPKGDLNQTTAKLTLFVNDKAVDSSNFYFLPKENSKNSVTMLTGVPLSSWWTSEANLYLLVKYNFCGTNEYEFKLPFTLKDKEFVSETIPLNAANTSIKTDTSPKRMTQIDKLNKILGTVESSSIYNAKPFISPTTATRRTSFFADRRVYAYSNGKSSTSLHYGIDFGVPTGTDVTACGDGKVVLAEERVSTGWSVVIEHLPGLYSLYYHMDSLKVKEGEMVKAGDLLGYSGCTGLATGPHLHWEMRLNMSAVSPDFFTTDFAVINELN